MTRDGRRVVATAPGKLFVAGEYAVVEGGEPAVLVGVERRITLTVTEAATQGPIAQGRYVAAVTGVMAALALARGRSAPAYEMSSSSALADAATERTPARKYGLGSSGAVTVAATRALDTWYDLRLTPMELLKAAVAATLRVNPRASGGDVAASLFGGWLGYSAASQEWIERHDPWHRDGEALADPDRVANLVTRTWPGLDVAAFDPPSTFALHVGWTGAPASTTDLVAAVRAAGVPTSFLRGSRDAVSGLMQALHTDDAASAFAAVREARTLLRELGERAGVAIETPQLAGLVEIAERHGMAAKGSGAGGGDCGIALGGAGVERLAADWAAAGIVPLPLEVATPSTVEEHLDG